MNDKYIGYPACLLTILCYLSKIIILFDFSKKTFRFKDIYPIKVFSNYSFAFFWYFFGVILYYDPIKISNLVGIFSFLFVICIGLFFQFKKNLCNTILNFLIVSIFTIAFYHYFIYIVADPNINGNFCIVISIINLIIKLFMKNDLSISLFPVIFSFSSSILWYKYGDLNKDLYIKFSFGIFVITDLIQLIIHVAYYLNYKKSGVQSMNYNIKQIDIVQIEDLHKSDNIFDEEKIKIKNIKK